MKSASIYGASGAGSGAGGAKARRMWFRRERPRAGLDLTALDRLSETVERIVVLLPDGAAEEEPAAPARAAVLLFVPTAAGYRLADGGPAAATAGARVELPEGAFRVLRLGPSPLPGDARRCAFLEREEPPRAGRTSDG